MESNRIEVKLDVARYLERIGYSGPIDGSMDTLIQIQERHLHTVPYENFDILKQIPLSLEIPDLFDKIVVKRRGGYCFELNALFSWLLQELGYNVTSYFARFWRDESNPPPKRRHQVLHVKAEGESYLCDVGVGGIVPRKPIKMEVDLVHEQGDEYYKLGQDPYYGWVLYEKRHGKWSAVFSFTEEPQFPKDFLMATYWCENAPESIFTKGAMVSIRTAEGRNSVSGDEFRIFTGDRVQAFTPESPKEYREALSKYFGIRIDMI